MGTLKQCAPAASRRAQANAVASGEVGSSDFSHQVVKRSGNNPERKPTDPSDIGSFTAQDGPGAKGTMGESSEGIAASSVGTRLGSCETHHVGISPQEDRGVPAGKVGKDQAAEEGCLDAASPIRNQHLVPNVTFPIWTHSRYIVIEQASGEGCST